MARLVKFSPYNPVQFVKQNLVLPEKFGYVPFGHALHRDSVKYWQDDTPYLQPWQLGDLVCLEIHATYDDVTSAYTNVNIVVPDGLGGHIVLENIAATDAATITGFTDADTGAQYYSYLFEFSFGDYSSLNGYNEVQLQAFTHDTDGTNTFYISNPISLATRHEGTEWIEYNQQTNIGDTIFEQLKPRFGKRIYSKGMTTAPGGVRTMYPDQNQVPQMLYGKAFTVHTLDIGGFEGMPEIEMALINTIITEVENVRIGQMQVTKNDAAMEIVSGEGKSRQWGRATFQLVDESDSYSHGEKSYLLWSRPVAEDEPYAIMNLGVTDNFTTIWEYKKVFDDAAAEAAYITAFNSEATTKGLDCELVEDDGDFYLVNTGTQKIFPYSDVLTFGGLMVLTVAIAGGLGASFSYSMTFPTVGNMYRHVVSWGATAGDDEGIEVNTSTGIATATKSFSAGTKTVRVFHNNDASGWQSLGSSFGGTSQKITNVTGEAPSSLQTFRIVLGDFSALTTLDISFLAPAKNSLRFLTIENSKLKGITAGWASSLVSGAYKPFPLLTYVKLDYNEWTVSNLNAFVIEYHDYCYWGYFQTFFVKYNSPAAAPTGTALGYLNAWIATPYFWNVQKD